MIVYSIHGFVIMLQSVEKNCWTNGANETCCTDGACVARIHEHDIWSVPIFQETGAIIGHFFDNSHMRMGLVYAHSLVAAVRPR